MERKIRFSSEAVDFMDEVAHEFQVTLREMSLMAAKNLGVERITKEEIKKVLPAVLEMFNASLKR